MKIRDIGEIGLINRLAAKTRYSHSVIKGIGDDTAVLKWTNDKYLLYTCDMLVEDVHFSLRDATPYQIGHKALARNLSDIAAMGGEPKYALVSIVIDGNKDASFADSIYKGIADLAKKFKVDIVGGDTSCSKKLVIDISVIGEVKKDRLTPRSGAKVGDIIFITGSIGGSRKGKHLDFIPRLAESGTLTRKFKINSMIDISDGLALDLWRILEASKAGARIYEKLIPLSAQADSLKKAIADGEDFELLFTMSVKEAGKFLKTEFTNMKAGVALIGEIMPRSYGYKMIGRSGKEKVLEPKGYLHF